MALNSPKFLGIFLILCGLFDISCKKVAGPSDIKISNLHGVAQKGPFVSGSSITLFELDSTFTRTGKSFNTKLPGDDGSFEFASISLSSEYFELFISGNYFNETTGDISTSPLALSSIYNINESSTFNINILTALEKDRIEYLISEGMSFSDAKDSAQQQVLATFGLRNNTIGPSETLDIFSNTVGANILLTISLILQMDRTSDSLYHTIELIQNDIALYGVLKNENVKNSLRSSGRNIDLNIIQANISNFFETNGISSGVPNLDSCLRRFMTFIGLKPMITLQSPTNLAITTVTLNSLVNPEDLSTYVTFEYGTSQNYGQSIVVTPPDAIGHVYISASAQLSGLTPGTVYHYKITATNDHGYVQTDDATFKTYNADAIYDYEGNYYNTVHIGNQFWMAENLKSGRLNDGAEMSYVNVNNIWSNLSNPGYCWPDNDEVSYKNSYGALYNWFSVNTSKLCPEGWHVPTVTEWNQLGSFLGGDSVAGNKIRESGTIHWSAPNSESTNESGFTALPAGFRYIDGSFMPPGESGYWWSSSEFSSAEAYRFGTTKVITGLFNHYRLKTYGYSVRCLKDG